MLTSSGSAALVLALTYSGAGPGKEVIFSSFSCPNVIDAVLQSGATPVFAQLDEHLSLSFEDVKKERRGRRVRLSSRTYTAGEKIPPSLTGRRNTVFLSLMMPLKPCLQNKRIHMPAVWAISVF